MLADKISIIKACSILLQSRLDELNDGIAELNVAMEGESKSSAGDKHETGRARLQTEQENLQRQRQETQILFQELLDPGIMLPKKNVSTGALVQTSMGVFLIGPALGKVKTEAAEVFVVSLRSPLGQQIQGKLAGDSFTLNGKEHQVIAVS